MDADQGKLFVGGISWETNEDKLKEHFSNYGDVLQAIVMRDKVTGRPRGFGFVLFSDPSVLDRVLQDKHHIDTREVDVKRAMTREEQQVSGRSGNYNPSRNSGGGGGGYVRTKKIFVGGLPPTLTDEAFRQYFEAYGSVADVIIMYDQNTNRPRGFGFVSFESEDSVDRVLHKTFHDLNGKQVEVKRALPKDAIPGGPGRSMGGSGNSYEGRVDSNRFMQHQNTGNGLPSYGSSGYGGAGYGYGSNGVGYIAYGGYAAGAGGGYGGPFGAPYGNPSGAPGAAFGSGHGGGPRSSWGGQPAAAGYGNPGYGNTAPSGYGGNGAAPSAQSPGGSAGFSNQGYGYGGNDSSYGNQPGFGAIGGRPSGGSNIAGGDLQGSGGGYNGGSYGDGSWRSDPLQGYGGGYNGSQGRHGQQ
ncbi:PREDICTED: heterogeneous nuclear ribonucleoprotein 1 [Tarenaya hassleriana]|uniref:heterogeneous nuclear ribonucleoprotein 1 n=1 Tax=Tarenaya hassleriana TaxID=28532 RepID=UPI00053C479D|nr:PREDICTED: heterogeneous nuclear ribonucleoprotein 1 [Tarenaya hassleriana]